MSLSVPRGDRPRIAVTTVVHREHAALLAQVDGLSLSTWPPDVHVAVSASDRELTRNRVPIRSDRWATFTPRFQVHGQQPGNAYADTVILAADTAARQCVDLLVHLDVRCIPRPDLLQTYAEHALSTTGDVPVLWHAAQVQLGVPGDPGHPAGGNIGRMSAGWPVHHPPGPTHEPVAAWSGSFAMRAEHWPAVRGAWVALRTVHRSATLADAVASVGGRCVRTPGAVVFKQHPLGISGRYVTQSGDRLISDSPLASRTA